MITITVSEIAKEPNAGKPAAVVAIYDATIEFNIKEVEEELKISWDSVVEYWVKWGCLHVVLEGGARHEIDGIFPDSEYKRPIETYLVDEHYDRIDGENNE